MSSTKERRPPDDRRGEALEELRQIRYELRKLRELLNDFAGVLLNSAYPYGRATDRWARHD